MIFKRTLVVGACLFLCSSAFAADVPNANFQLTVQADGSATLENVSGAPLSVDSYQILSAGGLLSSGSWTSIADQAVSDPLGVLTALGAGGLSFGELSATTLNLTEANLSNSALFASGAPFNIGTITSTPTQGDLTFIWTSPTITPGDLFVGQVNLIPEPATMTLLAVSGIAVFRRRRKK